MITTLKNRIRSIKELILPSKLERERKEEAEFLNKLFEKLLTEASTKKRVEYILSINGKDPKLQNVLTEHERALPGDRNFLESGWYKSMLTRYALAMHYSKGKNVLDTCSGLGWGAYLLEVVADELTCIELDQGTIQAAKAIWPYEKSLIQQGSVLQLPFPDNSFDIVTAMESIEHFELDDARIYMHEVKRVLKPKGRLIGSTPLPLTEEGIKHELAINPYHLHIFTPPKLADFLSECFSEVHVLHNNCFFWCIK